MDIIFSLSSYAAAALRITMLLIAIPIVYYVSYFIKIACSKRFSPHMGIIIGHIIFYGGIIFIGVNLLHEAGFNVTALLGAAGIIGVAIGFASQTSISNIISGFFLLLERPFSIGDTIKSGEVIGVAESIDLLAVRVKTFDNKLIRIPNETVLKNSLTNLTHYPTKRIDLLLSIPYRYDSMPIADRIINIISNESTVLTKPAPIITINKIGQLDFDTEIRIFFSIRAWVSKEAFSYTPTILIEQLKNEFDADNIIITVAQIN